MTIYKTGYWEIFFTFVHILCGAILFIHEDNTLKKSRYKRMPYFFLVFLLITLSPIILAILYVFAFIGYYVGTLVYGFLWLITILSFLIKLIEPTPSKLFKACF